MADDDAALGEEILSVTKAEMEAKLQPNGVSDDLGREAVTPISDQSTGWATDIRRGLSPIPVQVTHSVQPLDPAHRTLDVANSPPYCRPGWLHVHLDRPFSHPVPLTPLIGREDETASIRQQLLGNDLRMLTLTGPGGIGKTRLAINVAAEPIQGLPDGVVFVPLAPVIDPGLVASTIALMFGIAKADETLPLEAMKWLLRDKALLLILDSFEHVLPAAPVVAYVLVGCPHVKVLVTSRAALRISGEHEFGVPPLPLPRAPNTDSAEALSQYASVRLFIARAKAVNDDLAVNDEMAAAIARRGDATRSAALAADWAECSAMSRACTSWP